MRERQYQRWSRQLGLSHRTELGTRLAVLLGLTLAGCKDLTGSQPLPAGTVDPATYNTAAGAMGIRTQALYTLQNELTQYITTTGLLTDELADNQVGASTILQQFSLGTLDNTSAVDARVLPAATDALSGTVNKLTDGDYANLQTTRAYLGQARVAIAAYDTGAATVGVPRILQGELLALEGYTEILLADEFCSGVPLSTLDFHQDFTYHASLTKEQVYLDAIAKEDSALTLADTSVQVLNLARVLKGRALLALDSAAAAAQAVAAVPTGFQYLLAVNFAQQTSPVNLAFGNFLSDVATVSNSEGGTGLPYLSSGDPRSSTSVIVPPGKYNGVTISVPVRFPAKYSATGFSPFPVADWIEARLIQAEAAYLNENPAAMVDTLNQLRQTAMVQGQTTTLPADLTDPGSSLSGPAADSARIALLFQERAYWLFLTGHRQGDLRRLIRQYGKTISWYNDQSHVYPTGIYAGLGVTSYGSDVTAPIAGQEFLNPLFHGCLNRAP